MPADYRINALKTAIGVALIILITKATALLAPVGGYFTFGAFLYSFPTPVGWPAIVLKFAIPIIVGVVIGVIAPENPRTTAGATGFLAAFILAWPAVVAWNAIVPDDLADRQRVFLIVYLLYFASYAYLCMVGARLAVIYFAFQERHKGKTRTDIAVDLLDWSKTLKPAVVGATTGVLSMLLAKLFAKP
jgi:hypothetical protein